MSAVLIITNSKKQVAKVPISGPSLIMGRAPDCALPLDEALASRQHAEILYQRGSYLVRDCGSRNGTKVNGEKLAADERRELKDGDAIEIGATRLKFVWDKSEEDDDDADKTRVASLGDLEKKIGQEVAKKKAVGSIEVKLRVVDGPLAGGKYSQWESPLTIGRGLMNHVVLLDEAVSTQHAEIVQEGEAYFIADLKSINGTFLDGIKVQKARLADGSKIRIGESTLVFEMVDLRRRRKNLNVTLICLLAIAVVAVLVKFLQPPDYAGQHIAAAKRFADAGALSNALDEYNEALKIAPNRVEAKRGQAAVREAIEAGNLLNQADQAAAAENYDKAEELCYRVLRDFPGNGRALELKSVISSIQSAKVAFAAQNWLDAKRLLEKAQEAYPRSELLKSRFVQAKDELAAQDQLTQAKNDLLHDQFDLAQPLLESIAVKSVYYTEARQLLGQIGMNRQVAEHLGKAQSLYREGQIPEALQEIAAGLQQAANNSALLALQHRIRQMESLVKPLEAAETMSQPDDLAALLQYQKACEDVIHLEDDPLNALRKRAQIAAAAIVEKLQAAAQAAVAKAVAAASAGHRKDAFQWYELAARATPDDHSIADSRDELRRKIVSDCQVLYNEGRVHDDLGQSDLARQAYQKVLDIGIPGEDCYERASRKIKGLSP